MQFHIQEIPAEFLRRVRASGVDDQGNAVQRMRAAGGEPCRDVLRRAAAGEELILASFSPFSIKGPYKEFGPVFVLANESPEPVQRGHLPITDDARTYFREQFVLRAYTEEEAIADAALVTRADAAPVLERFLARDDVAFVDARFPTYGCFACRIRRTV